MDDTSKDKDKKNGWPDGLNANRLLVNVCLVWDKHPLEHAVMRHQDMKCRNKN